MDGYDQTMDVLLKGGRRSFTASEEPGFVKGHAFVVDGGLIAGWRFTEAQESWNAFRELMGLPRKEIPLPVTFAFCCGRSADRPGDPKRPRPQPPAILRICGIGGCYGPSGYERRSRELRGFRTSPAPYCSA